MLKNINNKKDYFDKKVIDKIKQCSNIRNSLAHNNPNNEDEYSINLNGKPIIGDISFFFEEYKSSFEFSNSELEKIVEPYAKLEKLNGIIKNLASFHVHVRNYKDWFVDIYDVEIEDENGNEISVDYPEYQFPTEDYEEEVITVVKSYLNEKYNANTDDISGEVIQDWYESESGD